MIKLKKANPKADASIDETEDAPAKPKKPVKKAKVKSDSASSGSSIGKTLGVVVLLLLLAGGAAVYLNPTLLEEASVALGLSEAAPEEDSTTPIPQAAANNQAGNAPAATAPPAPTFTADPAAAQTLNMAKVWVNTRLSRGTELLSINESIPLDAADKQHWQSVQVNQGTISAVHVNSNPENPTILLPMQNGNQITWVCAGAIPAALENICQ